MGARVLNLYWCLLLAGGCAENTLPTFTAGEDTKSIIYAIGDRDIQLYAVDAVHPELNIPVGGNERAIAVLYDDTLETLQIASGPVPLFAAGRPLPSPSSSWVSRAIDTGAWERLPDGDSTLAELRIEPISTFAPSAAVNSWARSSRTRRKVSRSTG